MDNGPWAAFIKVQYNPIGYAFWSFQSTLEQNTRQLEDFGFSQYDLDSVRMMAAKSSVWVLLLTYVVSVLHMIFEILSLGADVNYWREKTSFEGISSTTVILSLINDFIIYLYLRDSGETKITQYFILARMVLDVWKLRKLNVVRFTWRPPFIALATKESDEDTTAAGAKSGSAPKSSASTSSPAKFTPEELDAYENQMLKRLYGLLAPLVVGVAVYQLFFVPQKSWYSWAIHSLAVCAYGGGFVTMTPQLIRNHKLESVDHLPWNALTYQAFNTFIDDVFAFIIRMPQMHRMSVFRDDIIFIMFHIQRFVYRRRARLRVAAAKKTDSTDGAPDAVREVDDDEDEDKEKEKSAKRKQRMVEGVKQ
eukprot:Selendium_serpulae@DN5002_c1_g2_i3.p1